MSSVNIPLVSKKCFPWDTKIFPPSPAVKCGSPADPPGQYIRVHVVLGLLHSLALQCIVGLLESLLSVLSKILNPAK